MNFKHDIKKLFQTFWVDIKVQFRNGLYIAAIFVMVLWIVLASALPMHFKMLWLPIIILLNQAINSFYFLGAMVLFEKKDGTIDALVVSPLRPHEYLISKAVTLTLLSAIESVAIVLFGFGININTIYIVIGATSLSIIYSFLAFACVAPFDSITSFLFPSILIINIFQLNLLDYFGIFPNLAFYILPTQSSLLLLKAGFFVIAPWQIIYGIVGSIVWIVLSFWVAIYFFNKYIIRETGD